MSTNEYTENLEELITHGFEQIDPNEKVEVNLKDLMYVYSTLQEYMRFFHQPEHYKSLEDVQKFLGAHENKAGFKLLDNAVYEKMRDMFPEHINDKFGEGIFDSPKKPFYFNENR